MNRSSRFFALTGVLCCSVVLSGCPKEMVSSSGEPNVVSATPPPAPVSQKPPVEQPTAPLNAVAQAAQNAGVVDCVARINQVSSFLTTGSQENGASLSVSPQNPNGHISSTAFEIRSPQVLSYASADFAPLASGCGATYEAVTHWQNSCKDVATKGYAQLKFIGAIQKSILVLEGGPQLRVFLMPAGKGCVAIKKEVVY